MPPFDEQSRGSLALEANRLETPTMVGYRRGMSSSGVIGRKLGAVYSVKSDIPREIDRAICKLRSKLDRVG